MKIIFHLLLFPIVLTSNEPVKVLIPMEASPDFSKFWKLEEDTKSLSGFYIDVIDELFKIINVSYSIEYNFPPKYNTYNELGTI